MKSNHIDFRLFILSFTRFSKEEVLFCCSWFLAPFGRNFVPHTVNSVLISGLFPGVLLHNRRLHFGAVCYLRGVT